MPPPVDFVSSTGVAPLGDVGQLSYNGVDFSCLFKTEQAGRVVHDEANRTTTCVEWGLRVEGVVTSGPGAQLTTDVAMSNIRRLLSMPAGTLTYTGRGFGTFTVNSPAGGLKDLAWGPIPKVLDFKPLGAGRGAFVVWQVTTRIPEIPLSPGAAAGGGGIVAALAVTAPPVMQWNWECGLTFNDDGYSGLSVSGTLEIPLTRNTVSDRTVATTVDSFRQAWLNIAIDLSKFRVVRRHFRTSRDKRRCDWEYVAEELPLMGIPPYCTDARGNMSIRRFNRNDVLAATVQWVVTLRATYTVRNDMSRRIAAFAFYALWWYRMKQSALGWLPPGKDASAAAETKAPPAPAAVIADAAGAGIAAGIIGAPVAPPVDPAIAYWKSVLEGIVAPVDSAAAAGPGKKGYAIAIDFSVDEGLYLDSKTTSFEASWLLLTSLQTILTASGIWRWATPSSGGNRWAMSVRSVSGWKSWLANVLNPNQDIIVDLGGGSPPAVPFGG